VQRVLSRQTLGRRERGQPEVLVEELYLLKIAQWPYLQAPAH
jgi:hypothetical protein